MLGLLQIWLSLSVSHNRYTAFAADQQALLLEKEIKDFEKKKNDLIQLIGSSNGDFVKYSLTVVDENDPKKMKEMLVKGRGLKREADKAEKDIVEIEKTIELLKSKQKCK